MRATCIRCKRCINLAKKRKENETRPAVVANDLSKLGLVLAVVRVTEHILVVTVVRRISVLRDEVHVEDADVDAQSRLAVPVEVRRLRGVRHVVGRFQVAGTVEVFGEDVTGRFELHSCHTGRQHRCRVTASTKSSSPNTQL